MCFTVHAMSGTETDMKFLQKGSGTFGTHAHFRPLDTAFVVKHYAGDVCHISFFQWVLLRVHVHLRVDLALEGEAHLCVCTCVWD